MTRSPGHQKSPQHKVRESEIAQRLEVLAGGESIAQSRNAVQLDEDGQSRRYYIPREDINMNRLAASDTRTHCPFKGEARYFTVSLTGGKLKDAAWSYEEPYDEHRALKGYIAFHDELPELEIRLGNSP